MAYGYHGSNVGVVEHAWAHRQKESMRKGNVFFEGEIIYSYGHHFPMARLWKPKGGAEIVFFSDKTYSNTTSAHQSAVRGAISHKDIIRVWEVPLRDNPKQDGFTHVQNFEYWIKKMEELKKEVDDPRKRNKGSRLREIDRQRDFISKYMEVLKIKMPKELKKRYDKIEPEPYDELLKQEEERRSNTRERQERDAGVIAAERLAKWKKHSKSVLTPHGRRRYYGDWNTTYLRVSQDGLLIETSKNIRIPIDVAERYYKFYMRTVDRGGCLDNCNYKMLEFEVREMSAERLVVGCHSIPRSEIDEIAAKLNWNK